VLPSTRCPSKVYVRACVALDLGVSVLWQGAFQASEHRRLRRAALAQLCCARSSGEFGEVARSGPRVRAPRVACGARLPARAYADEGLLGAEREQLLRPAWQVLGHEAELRLAGDYLSGEVAGSARWMVRAERWPIAAPFRHTCRPAPACAADGAQGTPEERHSLRHARPHIHLRRAPGRSSTPGDPERARDEASGASHPGARRRGA